MCKTRTKYLNKSWLIMLSCRRVVWIPLHVVRLVMTNIQRVTPSHLLDQRAVMTKIKRVAPSQLLDQRAVMKKIQKVVPSQRLDQRPTMIKILKRVLMIKILKRVVLICAAHSKVHYEKDIETSCTLKRQMYVLHCMCSLLIICIIFRYSLKPLSNSAIDYYVDNVFNNLITGDAIDKETIMKKFSGKFKNLLEKNSPTKRWSLVCHILARN